MRIRVEKCSEGFTFVIPDDVATRVGLRDGASVELEVAGNRLVVTPTGAGALAELLAQITPDNLHEEWAPGPPVGAEQR